MSTPKKKINHLQPIYLVDKKKKWYLDWANWILAKNELSLTALFGVIFGFFISKQGEALMAGTTHVGQIVGMVLFIPAMTLDFVRALATTVKFFTSPNRNASLWKDLIVNWARFGLVAVAVIGHFAAPATFAVATPAIFVALMGGLLTKAIVEAVIAYKAGQPAAEHLTNVPAMIMFTGIILALFLLPAVGVAMPYAALATVSALAIATAVSLLGKGIFGKPAPPAKLTNVEAGVKKGYWEHSDRVLVVLKTDNKKLIVVENGLQIVRSQVKAKIKAVRPEGLRDSQITATENRYMTFAQQTKRDRLLTLDRHLGELQPNSQNDAQTTTIKAIAEDLVAAYQDSAMTSSFFLKHADTTSVLSSVYLFMRFAHGESFLGQIRNQGVELVPAASM